MMIDRNNRGTFRGAILPGLAVLAAGLMTGGHVSAESGADDSDSRMNVVVILTDDQRWDAFGAGGSDFIHTPVMDTLAENNVHFTNAFVTTSICNVSRASILTGQYMSLHGIDSFAKGISDNAFAQTYAGILREAGYWSGYVGKDHASAAAPGRFDFRRVYHGRHWYTINNEQIHVTERNARDSLDFLRTRPTDQPFLLNLNFFAPHAEDAAPEQYLPQDWSAQYYEGVTIPESVLMDPSYLAALPHFLSQESNEGRVRYHWRFDTPERYQEYMINYFRLITEVDEAIGRVIDELKAQGVYENTLIILIGDNGYFHADRGLADKWYPYEESIRVPLIINDPRIPVEERGVPRGEMVLNIDLAPTIVAAAGLPIPDVMQGEDLAPLYMGGNAPEWRDEFLYEHPTISNKDRIPTSQAVVRQDLKYAFWPEWNYEQLFDLRTDATEKINLIGDPAYVAELDDMRNRLDGWLHFAQSIHWAQNPQPANADSDVAVEASLSWTGSSTATAYDVYFGVDAAAVKAATSESGEYLGRETASEFQLDVLDSKTKYYWRIDSVDEDGAIVPGRIWSFDTATLAPRPMLEGAVRGYGGKVTLHGTLASFDGLPADATLYWGASDGGTDPEAWANMRGLEELEPGAFSVELDKMGEEAFYFRVFVQNQEGDEWSDLVTAPAQDDLAFWARSALIEIDFPEDLEELHDFPVLVGLSERADGFSYDELLSPPYGDLRFSDESGEVTLPHEVEEWNPGGTSLIWVRAPVVAAGARIRVWWGREGRVAPSTERRAEVWSNDYAGVWHLGEEAGFGFDSSPNGNTGSVVNVAAAETAVVAGAARFNGTTSAVDIANSPSLNPDYMTAEAWIRTTQTSGNASIISKDHPASGRVWQFRVKDGDLEFIVFNSSSNLSVMSDIPIATGEWRHVAGAWDGDVIRVYVDGELRGSAPFSGTLRAGGGNNVFIGRMQTANPSYFEGEMDEVRLSRVARSGDWIRASWLSQKPGGLLFGADVGSPPDLDDDLLPDVWEMHHFETIYAADGRALTDTSGNGVPDLVAYSMGMDPNSSTDLSAIKFIVKPDGSPPEFTYRQLAGGSGEIGYDYRASNLRYRVEVSRDLKEWHSGSDYVAWTGEREEAPWGTERVTVRLTDVGVENSSRIFARVRIEHVN